MLKKTHVFKYSEDTGDVGYVFPTKTKQIRVFIWHFVMLEYSTLESWGQADVQLVEALRSKPEFREFDSVCGHTMGPGSTQHITGMGCRSIS